MSSISIGTIGSVAWDQASRRFKGFLTKVCPNISSLVALLGEVVGQCHSADHDAERDARLTVRVLLGHGTNLDLVRHITLVWEDTILHCEALIPVGVDGLAAVAYFGANKVARASPSETRAKEWELVSGVVVKTIDAKQLPAGFVLEQLHADSVTIADLEQLVALYRECYSDYMVDFTSDSVRRMIVDNVVVVVRDASGLIVAVGQAERVVVETTIGPWLFVEISETATAVEFRSNGLSQIVRAELIRIVNENPRRTLVYAESRGNHAAVMVANWRNGMRFGGRLDAHARIDSSAAEVVQHGRYGNLFVMFLPVSSY